MSRVREAKRHTQLAVDRLEQRELLSANVVNGTLYVEAGDLDDVVRIDLRNSSLIVRENHELYRFDASNVNRIVVLTKAGHDRVTIDPDITLPVVVRAGSGDDIIRGGSGNDRIYGGSGNDRLYGRDGDDRLYGQRGDDRLFGQDGDDYLFGHRGHDELRGGRGYDRLRGGRDADDYYGHWDDDVPGHELREYEHHYRYEHRHRDDSPRDDSGHWSDSRYEYEVEYKAYLTGSGGRHAKVEYEVENEHGMTKTEFEVKVWGATPGEVLDVYVDGQLVGQVLIGPYGTGKLKYTTYPHKPGHRPFPDNFPTITDGTSVAVGDMNGTLRVWYS